MTILGNICLSLALLIFLYPLQPMLHDTVTRGGERGAGVLWGTIFVLVPLWFLLTVALCAATAKGGFDWLTRERAPQYLLVLAVCAAMTVVTGFSMALKHEPASQIPWAARPFIGWAVLVFPLTAMGFCLLVLNPKLDSFLPALAYRIPLAVAGGVSLITCGGLVLQLIASTRQGAAARVGRIVSEQNERDQSMLAEVERLDPLKDLGRLLDKTGPFETPAIRELALKKARSHPQFQRELTAMVQNEWCIETLTFLEANDPPDAAGLAEPVRVALLRVAARVRREMTDAHHLYDDSFDSDVHRALAVADRFSGHGVDYVPAIRELRAAFDVPRQQKIEPGVRRTIDAWLATHPKTN